MLHAVLRLLGIVHDVRVKQTKSGQSMAYVKLEDLFGSIELLVFPKVLAGAESVLQKGHTVSVMGRLSLREDAPPQLVCEKIEPAPAPDEIPKKTGDEPASPRSAVKPGLYIRVPSMDSTVFRRIQLVLAVFDGEQAWYVKEQETGKTVRFSGSNGVSVNNVMLGELRRIAGADNVVWVPEK